MDILKRTTEYFLGCILGGAIGDALGWPVEFKRYEEIIRDYGQGGIQDLVINNYGNAEITDDTQMLMFTAEGILRTQTRGMERGIAHFPTMVYHAYLRWLATQGYPKDETNNWMYDGWLFGVKELHIRRAPGQTCISALQSGKMGTINEQLNHSKGCGGVMRVAPAGLFFDKKNAFQYAMEFAAITHGHPSGYLSAGALAHIISLIIEGEELETAVSDSLKELEKYPDHQETSDILKKALELSCSDMDPLKAIEILGEGWVGEEALAISVYCAIKYKKDFKQALITSVNHDGDSDSTGAITGNILGAYLGVNSIPKHWVERVELKQELTQLAHDLLTKHQDTKQWWDKYPGY